jgi:hypothetical protein
MNTGKLIERVSHFNNLLAAFYDCSRGKRQKDGYQKYLFNYGEKLKDIEEEIKSTHNFRWGGYREFYVHDPKKRLVMAAPFRDRIVHTALYRAIEPIVDLTLGCRTYACRFGMGNRNAAIRLQRQLRLMGQKRYCVKLDVKKYFASVNHEILFKFLMGVLPESSLNKILWSLIKSHDEYTARGSGIPIGNLSSQLFANFYLSKLDQKACELLGIDFFEDRYEEEAGYIRYMDDMIILASSKSEALKIATTLVELGRSELKVEIPDYKYVILANSPIPFLGYVLDESGYRPLRRNERKFTKKIKRLKKKGYDLAYRAQVMQSYEAWQNLQLEV